MKTSPLLAAAAAVILTLSTAPALQAQNNPYDLDDACYALMQQADALIGRPGFREANDALLRTAIEKNDRKAQVIYYVERLRDYCQQKDAEDETVLRYQEELKQMARDLGYMQYYFQSYQFTKNFFFNKGQDLKALDILQSLQAEALAENSEYGQWLADKEMASFYQIYGANRIARGHIGRLIQTYLTTEDPTIRRQSLCQYYLDYAATFSPETDSVGIYLDKAWQAAVIPADSVKCAVESAKYAATKGDQKTFRHYRDLSLASPQQQALGRYTQVTYDAIEALFNDTYRKEDYPLSRIPVANVRVLSAVAEILGRYDLSVDMKDRCLQVMSADLGDLLDMNLAEMEARYNNDILSADLAAKSRQVEHTTRIIFILLAALLSIAVIGLLAYIRSLRRADEAKTRFLQNMTHELRTPLNAITGFSQLLAMPDGVFSTEEKEEFSGHIITNTKMLTMLLDDILNASAMDSGGYKINLEDAECGAICREAMRGAEHRVQPGVKLEFTPAVGLPYPLRTDPLRVQQVLTNLLTNAGKHTSQGHIRLGCSLEETPGMMTFSVEDTGPGIPPDQAERIFERFVKLDEFVQGTGLGLSICREIATKLGGRVWLDTTYTAGARFLFTIPVDSPAPL